MGVRERIIELRQANRLNKTQFAKKIGMPQPTYSKYESGERKFPLESVLQIARAFSINPLELLWEELGLSGTSAEKDYTDPIIEKTAQLMEDMPPEKRREVFNCAQEKKLLTDLLKQKAE